MEKEVIFEKVRKMLIDQLGVREKQIVSGAKFVDDLGADSLDVVEMVMSLEEQFGLEISDEEAEKLVTVGKAVDYVYDRLQRSSQPAVQAAV